MRYLMAGGGTGGHVIPAVNIARALRRFDPDPRFLFVGTRRGMEGDIVSGAGFEIEFVDAHPWRGVRSLRKLWVSTVQVLRIISRFKPHCAIGTGGYVSAPVAIASALRGIPLFIQEQNALPGLATKLGSLFARRVFLAFPEARDTLWRRGRAVVVGNPIWVDVGAWTKEHARRRLGLDLGKFTVLITGGSQGAAAINEVTKEMLERFEPEEVQFVWQCGEKGYSALRNWLSARELPVKLFGFIDDMSCAYAASDLVVARAGALTISEIAAFGLPAILIPYPYAAGDHQRVNARVFARRGAAVVIDQEDLTPALLWSTITELLGNSARRSAMSAAAKSLASPKAAYEIAKAIVDYTGSGR